MDLCVEWLSATQATIGLASVWAILVYVVSTYHSISVYEFEVNKLFSFLLISINKWCMYLQPVNETGLNPDSNPNCVMDLRRERTSPVPVSTRQSMWSCKIRDLSVAVGNGDPRSIDVSLPQIFKKHNLLGSLPNSASWGNQNRENSTTSQI